MSETVGSSKENKEWLKKELDSINKMFTRGFEMKKDVVELYVDKLSDCRKDYIANVLSDICRWKVDKMPLVGVIREEYFKLSKRLNPSVTTQHIDEDENTRERNLKKTVLALMNLYYKHGYTYVAESIFIKQIYAKLFGDEPFDFEKLKGRITKEMVMNYMAKERERENEKNNNVRPPSKCPWC